MNQSRAELIDIVGRILTGPELWDDPRYHGDPYNDSAEVRELATEIVTAIRPEARNYKYVHANGDPCADPEMNCSHP